MTQVNGQQHTDSLVRSTTPPTDSSLQSTMQHKDASLQSNTPHANPKLNLQANQASSLFHLPPTKAQRNIKNTDRFARGCFTVAGWLAGLMIILIFFFVASRGIRVFLPSYGAEQQNIWDFLLGMRWRADNQIYGVAFIIVNTLVSAFGAALLSFPLSVVTALMITRMAPPRVGTLLTTVVEVLASIPSVVFGVFASAVITRFVDSLAGLFGQTTAGGNAMLTTMILLAMMIFPTMTDIAIVAIQAVPDSLIQASLAVGATTMQTNYKMILRAARSGIFSGLVLGLGRAFGEATAVSMVAGNAYTGPSVNLFESTRTLTSTMLTGLKETTGLDYDIRFSVGIVLMILILITNSMIFLIKRKVGGGSEHEQ